MRQSVRRVNCKQEILENCLHLIHFYIILLKGILADLIHFCLTFQLRFSIKHSLLQFRERLLLRAGERNHFVGDDATLLESKCLHSCPWEAFNDPVAALLLTGLNLLLDNIYDNIVRNCMIRKHRVSIMWVIMI